MRTPTRKDTMIQLEELNDIYVFSNMIETIPIARIMFHAGFGDIYINPETSTLTAEDNMRNDHMLRCEIRYDNENFHMFFTVNVRDGHDHIYDVVLKDTVRQSDLNKINYAINYTINAYRYGIWNHLLILD